MHYRISQFIEFHNIFYDHQYGFRKGHSTIDGTLDLTGNIIKANEDKKLFGALFIDLSKAFDTIDHDILLHKMEHYGIRGRCLDWVRDYLTNRKIRVKINSNGNVCTSKEEFINIGTPQGSNLGLLFFSIFVNEIYLTLDHCTCILYADDTTIYYASADVNKIIRSLQSDLTKLIEWFKANKLSINLGKTKYMIFNPRMINATCTEKIKIGNITIDMVDELKFLGIIFDSQLSWKAHASALESKL